MSVRTREKKRRGTRAEYGVMLFFAAYFLLCYFLVAKFDDRVYTLTPPQSEALPMQQRGTANTGAQKRTETETAMPAFDTPDAGAQESAGGAESTAGRDAPYITDTRTVRTYRGGIGIYNCFDELIGSFDIDTALLPAADRESLAQGILFDSEGEMRNFLESLDS